MGLKALSVRVLEGLIFVSFAAEPPALDDAARALAQAAGTHGWARARVAHRASFAINANWKLAVENYMECYHCQPAHPEFARRHAYARPAAQGRPSRRRRAQRSAALGIDIRDVDGYGLNARARPGVGRGAAQRAATTGSSPRSADGRPVAPLMGRFPACDGSSTYFDVGPVSDFLAYADHGLVYRFIPRSVDRTELEVLWLVDAAAEEGRDYELERLRWLWTVTSQEDKQIIERNQEGVNSRCYEPGPYSLQEEYAARFVAWYLAEIGAERRDRRGREPALIRQVELEVHRRALGIQVVADEALPMREGREVLAMLVITLRLSRAVSSSVLSSPRSFELVALGGRGGRLEAPAHVGKVGRGQVAARGALHEHAQRGLRERARDRQSAAAAARAGRRARCRPRDARSARGRPARDWSGR